jgi:hypothetical protein
MTEGSLPLVGGAPACPFVAFEDDRDERGTSPDHRHRCYAEPEPAPRALAHQEAYCLSSAFPVCPTFQDWARREAAHARQPELPPAESDGDGADEEDQQGGWPPLVSDRPPRRGSRDAWAAPPPWAQGASGAAAGSTAAPGAAPAAGGAGLSGSFADRLASDRDAGGAAPGASGRDDESGDREPGSGGRAAFAEDAADEGDARASTGLPPRRRERLDSPRDRDEATGDRDVQAPSWERPRRLETYPTIRSRRLSAAMVPPLLIGVVALALAAGALFILPTLLGIGGPGGPSPVPSPGASAVAGESVEPTGEPAATPLIYTVLQGDTLTKIAKKFGISLADLIAANKATHPNPDVLNVGDQLIIPTTTPTSLPAASSSAAP